MVKTKTYSRYIRLRIDEIMAERNMHVVSLAEQLGVSQGYLSNLRRNVKFPSGHILAKMVDLLDIGIEDLIVVTRTKKKSRKKEASV
jgi:DNA-binding Xre family transcriptional regulator